VAEELADRNHPAARQAAAAEQNALPALRLLAIDPASEEASDQLTMILDPRRDRSLAMYAAINGKQTLPGGSSPLIDHLHDLVTLSDNSPIPALPNLDGDAPDFAVLARVHEERLRLAWQRGDRQGLLHDGAALSALWPQHPLQPIIHAIHAILTAADDDAFRQIATLPDDVRLTVTRGLAAVTADDQVVSTRLLDSIPSAERSGAEMARWARGRELDLEQLVALAEELKDASLVRYALARCLQTRSHQAADRLLALLDPNDPQRAAAARALALDSWAAATLGDPEQRPRLINPRLTDQGFSFHLIGRDGSYLDGTTIAIRLGDDALADSAISRCASLVEVTCPPPDPTMAMTVSVGGIPVFEGSVPR
ncbi:MAG: hypothetical protein ACYTF0_02015, partial [Planctomycetota bacterium]